MAEILRHLGEDALADLAGTHLHRLALADSDIGARARRDYCAVHSGRFRRPNGR